MAQKAKVLKDKKKFPWDKVKYYLSTLVKNDTAMEAAKKSRWFVAIPLFIISVLISIIPVLVSAANAVGSNYLSQTYSDAYYYGLNYYVNDDNAKDIIFKENYEITFDGEEKDYRNLTTGDIKPFYTYNYTDGMSGTVTPKLYMFYIPSGDNYQTDYTAATTMAKGDTSNPSCSYIIFTPTNFYYYVYYFSSSTTSYTAAGGVYGNYKYLDIAKDTTFKQYLSRVQEGVVGADLYFANFKTFVNKVYTDTRTTATWAQFGIMFGLNGGLTLLMGFVFWLMTRGKRNPFRREITLWNSQKIAYWLAVTPGLLSLIMGFIVSSYSVMIYVVCFGVRSMWLAMKNLRPDYQQNQ